MKTKIGLIALVIAALSGGASFGDDAGKAPSPLKPQTTCPVMGGPVDKSKFVDYNGKRIYVCCAGCIAEVKKNPAKYVKQLEDAGITLDKTPPAKTE